MRKQKILIATFAILAIAAAAIVTYFSFWNKEAFKKDNNNDVVILLHINSGKMGVNGIEKDIGTAVGMYGNGIAGPFKDIMEELGGKYEWDEAQNRIKLCYGNKQVEITIGKDTAIANGAEVPLESPVPAQKGNISLPVEFVANHLGIHYIWDPDKKVGVLSKTGSYVAVIADQVVTQTEFTLFLYDVKRYIEGPNNIIKTEDMMKFWNSSSDGPARQKQARERALDIIKDLKVQIFKARQNNLMLEEKDMQIIQESLNETVHYCGNLKQADQWAQEMYHVSFEDYSRIIKMNSMTNKLKIDEKSKISPDDEILLKYYSQDPLKHDKWSVAHILISARNTASDSSLRTEDEARKMADDILMKAKTPGQDFSALVRQYSEDDATKSSGGEFTFSHDEAAEVFENWVLSASDGDIGVLRTVYGFHIVKMLKKYSFHELKDAIKDRFLEEKYSEKLERWKKEFGYVLINKKIYDSMNIVIR